MIRFGFCDILNNQGLSKCYQPPLWARLMTLTSTLIIPDITKASSSPMIFYACNFKENRILQYNLENENS